MAVRRSIQDGKRAGKGELNLPLTDLLAGCKIVRAVGRAIMRNLPSDCRKLRFIGAITQFATFKISEINSRDMAAMIMDIVLAPHFTVCRQTDACIDLEADHLFGCPAEQRLVGVGNFPLGISERHIG